VPSESLIDDNLFIKRDLSNPSQVFGALATDRQLLGHFASQLLLYDRLIIPTYGFGILPILISWLGVDLFDELVQVDAIKFIRRRGLLSYVGNGNAISTIGIEDGPKKTLPWWSKALFAGSEESIELQLKNSSNDINNDQIKRITGLALPQTFELEYENDFFIENVANESYRDVMKSKWLSSYVTKSSNKRKDGSVDLRWLPQVKPNQTRVVSASGRIKDPVDMLLNVAEVNMQLIMASQTGGADLLTSQGAEILLHEKLQRAGLHADVLEGFVKLLEIKDLPDIRAAIHNSEISFDDIWGIRNKPNSIQFRKWLREEGPRNSQEFIKAYVQTIERETMADKLPVRLLRLAVTTAAGLIPGIGGLIGGLAADGIDSFFVDKWLQGYTPKLFLDEIKHIAPNK